MPDRGPASACPTPPGLGDFLGGVDFPIGRDALVERAQAAGAPEDVRQTLETLEPQDFESPDALYDAVAALSQ